MGEAVWALGAMSGTSLDGVDAAMVLTDGETIEAFGETGYRAYSEAERATLRAALGRWPDEPGVAEAARVTVAAHAELLSTFPQARLVGFHGQTLAHDPDHGRTHQAGDGAALAGKLGRTVVWDFRSEDVARGGQGAPLAPFFHFACAKWFGATAPVAFLNLGGVGNLTWIDPSKPAPEVEGACLAFDTGPANAPINDLMQARQGVSQDEGGRLAAEGRVYEATISAFLGHPYFSRRPPKSLDRNDFHDLLPAVSALLDADAAATLTAAAAAGVAEGARHFPRPPERLLVTGGGRRNATLMQMIADRVGLSVMPVEAAGLDGDMLEAQAFAYLAVRVLTGLPISAPGTTGVQEPVCGGRISQP